jgi:hypothetical protein
MPNLHRLALGLCVLALAGTLRPASAQVTVHISEGMTVQAYDVDLAVTGTIEASGTLDTRGATITFEGPGGIVLGGGLAVELSEPADFEGTTINGPVQLQGTLQLRVAPETTIGQGETFTVLTCSGGCTGTFEGVESPFAVEVGYAANEVTVTALEGFSTPVDGAPLISGPATLHAPYPNPFSSSTTVRLDLDAAVDVRVDVYDLLGRRVAIVAEGILPAGTHDLRWDAADLGAGAYFVTARVGTRMIGAWQVVRTR